MPYFLVTPPSEEPLTLTEAKRHLRVDYQDDDDLIGALLVTARSQAEMKLQRQLVSATGKLVLDAFPGQSFLGAVMSGPFGIPKNAILLNKSPMVSVASIKY